MIISLKLLGNLLISDGEGRTLSLPTRKSRALLAYLGAKIGKPQPRERLAALLWSRSDTKQANQSLNQALTSIRKLGQILESNADWVALRIDAVEIDLDRFLKLLEEVPSEAVKLYHGPLLDGLSTSEPEFEDWLSLTRTQIQNSACNALKDAAEEFASNGDWRAAIRLSRHLVALNPLDENGHRLLMRFLGDSGDRTAALQQYQICKDHLQNELQVEPDKATQLVLKRIKSSEEPGQSEEAADARHNSDAKIPHWSKKPSIAVLPFANLSPESEQEIFVDGLVEDILTMLAQIPTLFVIARNSSFQYKGRSADVRDVGQTLGVRFILQGSVRRAGDQIRVTAQLVECANSRQVWADRYDGVLSDVFTFQDNIAQRVVTELEAQLTEGEMIADRRSRIRDTVAFEKYSKARELHWNFARRTHFSAQQLCIEILEIDPQCTPVLYLLGIISADQGRFGWVPDQQAAYAKSLELAARGLKIDSNYCDIFSIISYTRSFQHRHDEAVAAAEEAVASNPNSAAAYHMSAMAHIFAGNFRIARDYELQYCKLSPLVREPALVEMARAEFHLGNFREAIDLTLKVLERRPRWLTARTILLAALWELGRVGEAQAAASEIKADNPRFSVERWASIWPYRRSEHLASLLEPLRLSGL